MIHYTCDRCKRAIDPETEARFVVEIDVRPAGAIAPVELPAEDLDQLSELHDQLQREVGVDCSGDVEDEISEIDESHCCGDIDEGPEQYDLCEQCHETFASNPLGREIAVGYGFSNN